MQSCYQGECYEIVTCLFIRDENQQKFKNTPMKRLWISSDMCAERSTFKVHFIDQYFVGLCVENVDWVRYVWRE